MAGGIFGVFVGGMLITVLSVTGVPAVSFVLKYLFGGSHLFPFLSLEHVLSVLALNFVVAICATFYPAAIAMKVPPIEALRTTE